MQFGSTLSQGLCSLTERVVGQFKFSHSDCSDAEKLAGMNWINLSLSHIVDTVIVCPALCGAHPSYCILLVFDQILRHPGLMIIAESLLQRLAFLTIKKVSHSMLHVFVEFQTPQIVQL